MRSNRISVLTFTLAGNGPLSIGDPERADLDLRIGQSLNRDPEKELVVDIPVAQRPQWLPPDSVDDDQSPRPEEAIIRGSSLFGALRAYLAMYALRGGSGLSFKSINSRNPGRRESRAATLADLLCGSQPEEVNDKGVPVLRPSALRLVLADLTTGNVDKGHTRTAIDRRSGTAAVHKLFRRAEVLDPTIDVVLQVDLALLDDVVSELEVAASRDDVLQDLVTVVCSWRPRLGGLQGTGRGDMELRDLKVGTADPIPITQLIEATCTVALMRSIPSDRGRAHDLVCCDPPRHDALWSMRVAFRCTDPLLIAPDKVDRTTVSDKNVKKVKKVKNVVRSRDVVFGSSWRGVLRSRCEFILRSCGVHACESTTATCGRCPTCLLFGWSRADRSADNSGPGARGLIRFLDSRIQGPSCDLTHAPIDRFTGGAADKKLYTYLSWGIGSTVTLHIEQQSAQHPLPRWTDDLLTMAIRDISDGYVGIGHATTRGYGTLALAGEGSPDKPLREVRRGWLDEIKASYPGNEE